MIKLNTCLKTWHDIKRSMIATFSFTVHLSVSPWNNSDNAGECLTSLN